ncbi:MAG: type II toxin-antitoxin system VapB family antitoxin [Spirochaetaceae bacterium]|jgi:hypothetical protein|nr:type II toxin-antitoxin system VapB family antitoxin [Spirochaetaceae bacterium]
MTTIAVEDTLAQDALRLSAYETMEAAMEEALKVFIAARRRDTMERDNELFGMWKDRPEMEDVEGYVRNMRKGRTLP